MQIAVMSGGTRKGEAKMAELHVEELTFTHGSNERIELGAGVWCSS